MLLVLAAYYGNEYMSKRMSARSVKPNQDYTLMSITEPVLQTAVMLMHLLL